MGTGRTLVFAAACGLIVANIYFAQPLIAWIGQSLNLRAGTLGIVVTVTQLGYATGLILLVPLGDLLENRRLVVATVAGAALGLVAMALARSAALFFVGAFLIGVCSVAVQILVSFAAQLAPDESRGRVVGNVMSGLMAGILLARPAASLVAAAAGWRWVFGLFAVVMVGVAVALGRLLPFRHPRSGLTYGAILRSLKTLLLTTPILQRRAAYQAFLFGCFSLFWTAVPLVLAGPAFGYGQRGIGFFALAGAAGAVVSPLAGRLADRGWIRAGSGICMLLVALSFGLGWLGVVHASVSLLVASAILLDMGATANLVLGQRAVFSLPSEIRSRLNGLFIAIFFLGGAAGSALAGYAYAQGGWAYVSWVGLGLSVGALLVYATEFRRGDK
jgi:predicted MFS family arabinose efflux permease